MERFINLNKLLDKIKELDEEATKGPWKLDMGNWSVESANRDTYRAEICAIDWDSRDTLPDFPNDVHPYEDGEFIAFARMALPQVAKALEIAVKELKEIAQGSLRQEMRPWAVTEDCLLEIEKILGTEEP